MSDYYKMADKFDLCIIGAGAAGLMAAITAATDNLKVAIVEKNTSAGRKLLLTGGGRCNITNHLSAKDFADRCKPYTKFLKYCIYEFSPQDMIDFLAEKGVQTAAEPDGCVFPTSNKAIDVRDAMNRAAIEAGVKFFYDKPAADIKKTSNGFIVDYKAGQLEADKVLIATGGLSYPKTGSNGDGYEFARKFGHNIIKPKSCLVPLLTEQKWVGCVAGVSVEMIGLAVAGEKKKQQVQGGLIFTADGIGGPAVLNFSRKILPLLEKGKVEIFLDLLPQITQEQLPAYIDGLCNQNPKKELSGLFGGLFARSLVVRLGAMAGISDSLKAASVSKKMRQSICRLIKSLPLTIIATKPIDYATVTSGGVDTAEIDPLSMQSKICSGLYFAGEVIDIDGPCGGYNLQIAFSTAHLAAKSVVNN